MTILITGAGMIGAQVAAQLIERGETPVLFDNTPSMENLKTILDPNKVKIVRGDILNLPEILHVIKNEKIDRIIHTAGLLLSGIRERPYAGVEINVMGTLNVLEAARVMNVGRVVFSSTGLIMLGTIEAGSKGPYHEDYTMKVLSQRPKILYPTTKLACEHIGLNYHDLYGVDFVTVRFSSVFGPWLGMASSVPGRIVDQFIKPAIKGEPVIIENPLLSFAGGSDFIYSKDAAKSCICACDADDSKIKQRVYNVTGGQFLSFQDLADTTKKIFPDAEIVLKHVSEHGSGGTPNPRWEPTDISKAREEIGYEPDYTMEAAMLDYSDWLRKFYIERQGTA